jgi:Leucine-rich repeat (LRR) protein
MMCSQLIITKNRLVGSIPAALPPSLTLVNLWNNRLTGSIPDALSSLTALSYASLPSHTAHTCTHARTADDGLMRVISATARVLVCRFVELSSNNLTGTIPAGFGKLPALSMLDLSSNQLTGDIPPYLGANPIG